MKVVGTAIKVAAAIHLGWKGGGGGGGGGAEGGSHLTWSHRVLPLPPLFTCGVGVAPPDFWFSFRDSPPPLF